MPSDPIILLILKKNDNLQRLPELVNSYLHDLVFLEFAVEEEDLLNYLKEGGGGREKGREERESEGGWEESEGGKSEGWIEGGGKRGGGRDGGRRRKNRREESGEWEEELSSSFNSSLSPRLYDLEISRLLGVLERKIHVFFGRFGLNMGE